MRHQYHSDKLKFYIGDVRSPDGLRDAMEGVDYVFHAAALKQVPSCEFYPLEAVQTNVLGAANVLTAAIQAGVQNVVVLSTDKAAYPVNAMGMSKGLMEKVTIARSRVAAVKGCTLCVTRYGNVMASRGSVIPLVRRADSPGPAADADRPEHDPLHDVAGRRGGPGGLRLPARPAGRPVHRKGPRRPPSARWPRRSSGCSGPTTRSASSAPGTARNSTKRC